MLKLVQEMSAAADIISRKTPAKLIGPLMLQVHSGPGASKTKRSIRIRIQNPPDIPCPVKIKYLPMNTAAHCTPQ